MTSTLNVSAALGRRADLVGLRVRLRPDAGLEGTPVSLALGNTRLCYAPVRNAVAQFRLRLPYAAYSHAGLRAIVVKPIALDQFSITPLYARHRLEPNNVITVALPPADAPLEDYYDDQRLRDVHATMAVYARAQPSLRPVLLCIRDCHVKHLRRQRQQDARHFHVHLDQHTVVATIPDVII